MEFLTSWTAELHRWEWLGRLLARLAVGLLFVSSGWGKLFVPASRRQMRDTIRQAGLPFPERSATALSALELVAGCLLVAGFLTPLAAVLLIGLMLGALVTTVVPTIQAATTREWLGAFLYLPEVLYAVILGWLLLSGPGPASIDHLLGGP